MDRPPVDPSAAVGPELGYTETGGPVDDGTLQAVRRLAAGVAHELNNPLTVLQLRADLLLETPHLDDDLRQQLDVLSDSTGRIARIVRALHQLARAPEDRTVVSFGVVVDAALRLLLDELPAANVAATAVPGAVLGDHDGLVYAVHQAIRHAAVRGPAALRAGAEGGRVVLTVVCDGLSRSDEPLGLTLAAAIVAAHGGRLVVRSDGVAVDLPAHAGGDPRRSGSQKSDLGRLTPSGPPATPKP